ncbi:unnamed protein product, partial [Staurois parvus]
MGTDRWHFWGLTGGTDGATLIIRALMSSVHMPSEDTDWRACTAGVAGRHMT